MKSLRDLIQRGYAAQKRKFLYYRVKHRLIISYQAIVNASAVDLLTVRGMKPENFLKGGQALERAWLAITERGLSMQPMTAITLFWLRWQIEGEKSLLKKHYQLLRHVWKEYRELFPQVDFSREGHVMLFRLGYGKEVQCVTYRKKSDIIPIYSPYSSLVFD